MDNEKKLKPLTTAQVLGAYRQELIDNGITNEALVATLITEAQRSILSRGHISVDGIERIVPRKAGAN